MLEPTAARNVVCRLPPESEHRGLPSPGFRAPWRGARTEGEGEERERKAGSRFPMPSSSLPPAPMAPLGRSPLTLWDQYETPRPLRVRSGLGRPVLVLCFRLGTCAQHPVHLALLYLSRSHWPLVLSPCAQLPRRALELREWPRPRQSCVLRNSLQLWSPPCWGPEPCDRRNTVPTLPAHEFRSWASGPTWATCGGATTTTLRLSNGSLGV
ncbi:hypothetical protein P7K49_014631 [Saguinus oedipus]|uniref:Uncharacterized protein n=1 Tax=Saguinus oedipus TaxID=9490 RepID=A0ABQ9V7B4_SAGOE|nr:hypothetical protein P7K49_014631 [Saguinus oedipus]